MEKRTTTITKMTIVYIVVVVSLVLTTTLLWALSMNTLLSSENGVSKGRADGVESEINEWVSKQETGKLDLSSFPKGADYVYENSAGEVLSKQIHESEETSFPSMIFYLKSKNISKISKNQDIYLRLHAGEDILFIHYSLGVHYEWLALFAAGFLYILDFVIPTIIFIKKIKRNVSMINEYAKKLSEQNLSVTSIQTEIKELNEVVDTLEMMRHELQSSMESKWAEQQKKREEMARIAHDLKTPLTIIRGNADLLMEASTSFEEREELSDIINNCERIARSILEIISTQ